MAAQLAIIRVRGLLRRTAEQRTTFEYLNITTKQACAIFPDTPSIRGMIRKVDGFITWGEVDDETIKLLEEKKGKQKTYNLQPPRGGFERKGTKVPYSRGGALGYRGSAINDLIKRMI